MIRISMLRVVNDPTTAWAIQRVMGDMYRDHIGEDGVFIVGSSSRRIPFQTCVICAHSPVFRAELLGGGKGRSQSTGFVERRTREVRIPDVDEDVFSAFVEFLTTGHMAERDVGPRYCVTEDRDVRAKFNLEKRLELEYVPPLPSSIARLTG
eukprot:m51a1_g2869 hypothetical protein (152) ;mRNA; r:362556-363147